MDKDTKLIFEAHTDQPYFVVEKGGVEPHQRFWTGDRDPSLWPDGYGPLGRAKKFEDQREACKVLRASGLHGSVWIVSPGRGSDRVDCDQE